MKIILVRHGETIENQMGICQGQMEGTLSDKGQEQAKQTANYLKNDKIDIIYSSDLKRALDTANEIATHFPTVPFYQDIRIRERYFGSYQGKQFPDDKKNIIIPPDAETDDELYFRVNSFLNEITKNHFTKTVLVISHGVTIRMFLAALQNQAPSSIYSIPEVRNSSISIIEVLNNKLIIMATYNSDKHLSA